MRRLLFVPGFVARVALASVAATLAVLAILTNTGVGRDATRRSLEAAFARQFDGTLTIGELQGSFLGVLVARDVVIRLADGDTLLTVARVRARPTWRGVRDQSLELRALDLDAPVARLHRAADGRWRMIRLRRATTGPKWDFGAPIVRVTRGTVVVSNDGPVPGAIARGEVADVLNARYEGIDGAATVEWTRSRRLFVVERLAATIAPRGAGVFAIDDLAGQFVQANGVTTLAGLRLEAGATDLRASLRLVPDSVAAQRARAADRATPSDMGAFGLRARLDGTADADALRRLVPALPLGGRLRIATSVDASRRDDGTAAVRLDGLDVATGSARLRVPGTLALTLTSDSLAVTSGPASLRLTAADVSRTLPRLAPGAASRISALVGPGAALDLARLHLALDRTTPAGAPPRLFVSTDGAATVPDADVRGRVAVATSLAGLRWDVDADVRRADLDRLARATGRTGGPLSPDGPTTTAGRIVSTGTLASGPRGTALIDRLSLDGRLSLGPSTLAGRRVDSLTVDGRIAAGGRVDAAFALAQRTSGTASRARGRIETTLANADRRVRLDATLTAFDVAALNARPDRDALRSRLTGTVRADLRGASLATLAGDLAVRLDDARLTRDARTADLGALALDATLTPGGDDRLVLESEALSADVTGTLRSPALGRHAAFYGERLAGLARTALRPRGDTARVGLSAFPPDAAPVRLTGRVRVRDASALGAVLPVGALLGPRADLDAVARLLATTGGDLDATVDARVDGGGLRLAVDAASAHLRAGDRHADGLRLSATLADDGVSSDPALFLTARLDSARLPTRIGATTLKADLLGAAGTVALRADDGSVVAEGTLTRPDREKRRGAPLRLALRRLAVSRNGLRLSAPAGAAVDLYADAVVVPTLVLDAERSDLVAAGTPGTGLSARQQVTLRGVVSARSSDTLSVRAAAVDLGKLLGKRPERAPLGGTLDADVALSALLGARDLTGTVRVRRLTMGPFTAGDLTARAYFRPGEDTSASAPIRLDLVLAPAAESTDSERAAASHLRASGTFRLPDAVPGSPTRDGALDLAFDAARLDASVLDAIFPDLLRRTTGTITGAGTVTGSLRRPSFDGTVKARDVRVAIPRFGLAYAADGDGRLDGDGLVFTTLRATDPTGGTLDATGRVDFNRYRYLSIDVRMALREALVLNVPASNDLPFYGRLWASGEATLSGPVSHVVLRAPAVTVAPRSEASIPIRSSFAQTDTGFLVFADSTGRLPDLDGLTQRESVFRKPEGERTFVEGMDMEINLTAPPGTTVNLVMDPLRGDVMRARGSGRLQLARRDGEFTLFGGLDVSGGDYLFTASDLFARRFRLDGGTITWDGDPVDPALAVSASYRTRASLAGLPQGEALGIGLVPLVVRLDLGERLQSPSIGLSLALDRAARSDLTAGIQGLEAIFNEPERQTEYATSVLLTNSFLLTTSLSTGENVGGAGNRLAFASLSQLVGAQINRYLSSVVPGLEFTLGLDGAQASDLDVSAGVALRLLDERLVIRGEGVFATESTAAQPQGLRGAFVVEVRLSPAVSVEVYYRREDDALERLTAAATNTTGASLSYRATFTTWSALWRRLTGRRTAPPD